MVWTPDKECLSSEKKVCQFKAFAFLVRSWSLSSPPYPTPPHSIPLSLYSKWVAEQGSREEEWREERRTWEPFLFSMNALAVPEVLWSYWRRFDGITQTGQSYSRLYSLWIFQDKCKLMDRKSVNMSFFPLVLSPLIGFPALFIQLINSNAYVD